MYCSVDRIRCILDSAIAPQRDSKWTELRHRLLERCLRSEGQGPTQYVPGLLCHREEPLGFDQNEKVYWHRLLAPHICLHGTGDGCHCATYPLSLNDR